LEKELSLQKKNFIHNKNIKIMEPTKYTPESVWEALQESNRILAEKQAEYWLQLKDTERIMKEKQSETDRILTEKQAETDRILKEKQAETERIITEYWSGLKELRESQAETERFINDKFAKTDEKIEKLTEQQAKTDQHLDKLSLEMDKRQAKTDQQIDKLTINVNNLNTETGGIGGSMGSFAEEYFYNSFAQGKRNFFGENFDEIKKNVPGGERNTEYDDEYDIVLYNCKSIGIIEVKFKARTLNIKKTIDKVNTFRAVYPEYANHQIYLAIAAMSFFEGVEDKFKEKGIAIVKPLGDKIIIYEDDMKAY
jgi:hypothetical protein